MTFSSYLSVFLLVSFDPKFISSQYHYTRLPPYLVGSSTTTFPVASYIKPKCRNLTDLEGPYHNNNPDFEPYGPVRHPPFNREYPPPPPPRNPHFNRPYTPPPQSSENFGGFFPGTTYPHRDSRLNQIPHNNNNNNHVNYQPQQQGKTFHQIQNGPNQTPTKPSSNPPLSQNPPVASNSNTNPQNNKNNNQLPSTPSASISETSSGQTKNPAESQQNFVTHYPTQTPQNNWNNGQLQNHPNNGQQQPANELVMLQNLTTLKFVPNHQLKNCVPIPGAHGACVILQHEGDLEETTTHPPLPQALLSPGLESVPPPPVPYSSVPMDTSIQHHHHMIQPAIIHENIQMQPHGGGSVSSGRDTVEILEFKPSQPSSQNPHGYYEYSVNNQHVNNYNINGQSGQEVIDFKNFQRGVPTSQNNGAQTNPQFEESFNVGDKLAHVNTMFHQGMKGVFGRNSISQALSQQQQQINNNYDGQKYIFSEEDKDGEGSEKDKVVKVPFEELPQSKEFYMKFLKLWSYYHKNFVCKEKLSPSSKETSSESQHHRS